MSKSGSIENLLIDFDNLSVGTTSKYKNDQNQQSAPLLNSGELKCNSLLGTSVPLYQLWNSMPSEVDDNNPFDQIGKQAALLDDPFEIVANAALSKPCGRSAVESVQTGNLISIDGLSDIESGDSKACSLNASIDSNDSVQDKAKNTSPKIQSNRGKSKNTSLNLLKYSLSNSRTDVGSDKGSPQFVDHQSSGDEAAIGRKRQPRKIKTTKRRDSGTDDSFDDIWSTKPNLIDSETDLDVDSDLDSDIAKLNIPMLNKSINEAKPDDKHDAHADEVSTEADAKDVKPITRDKLLEKLASIKFKIPSPPQLDTSSSLIQLTNRTVELKKNQTIKDEEEPVTPKCQYSAVLPQHRLPAENTDSLIENLKKIVAQCDDKNKQLEAKNLLDSLSSILTQNSKEHNVQQETPPAPIKREGTFSIEKHDTKEVDISKDSNDEMVTAENKAEKLNVDISEMVKQIQNAFGSNQNINVLQPSNDGTNLPMNPIIVVMAQPPVETIETNPSNDSFNNSYRMRRSSSYTLKERPLAAVRAAQAKVDQQKQPQMPENRPKLVRRGSLGTIPRNKPSIATTVNTNLKKDEKSANAMPKVVTRRRSFQGGVASKVEVPKPAAPAAPLPRRRSFNCLPPNPSIRSPSPKLSQPSRIAASPSRIPASPTRLPSNLVRRRSLNCETTASPKIKTSYGIMKKPSVPPAAKNLKIRVTQTLAGGGRSTQPMRAVIPMSRVAPMMMNGIVSPIEEKRPNSISASSAAQEEKGKYF